MFMKACAFILKSHKGIQKIYNMDYKRLHCSTSTSNVFKMKVLKYFEDILDTSPQITEEKSICISSLLPLLESPEVFMKEEKKFDVQCSETLHKMSTHEIFKILNILTKLTVVNVFNTYFYKNSIELLKMKMSENKLNKHEILQLLYYAGFLKKSGKRNVIQCMKLLKDEDFSLFEQCIIAETAFKCAVHFGVKQKISMINTIQKGYDYLFSDAHLLVIVCKTFRYNNMNHVEVLKEMGTQIISSNIKFALTRGVHVLQMYAEMVFDDHKILDRLVTDIMRDISNQNAKDKIGLKHERACKYLNGFLWAIAILNYKLSNRQLLEVLKFKKSVTNHLLHNPTILVSILLGLKIIGIKIDQEVYMYFKDNIFDNIIKSTEIKWKPRLRLQLLAESLEIESPHIEIPTVFKKNVVMKQKPSATILILLKNVEELSEELNLSNIRVNFPIYGLSIMGVSCTHPSLRFIHIDILDESTCLKVSNEPYGLLKFKRRLLEKLYYVSILIRENDVKDKEMLGNQIKSVLNEYL